MLQSMTGFGNASSDSEFGKISIDVKSLNSKTLDLNYSLNPIGYSDNCEANHVTHPLYIYEEKYFFFYFFH